MPFAAQISDLLLGTIETGLARIAIAGLWVLTLSEYLLTIFRLDERAKAFFTVTMLSVISPSRRRWCWWSDSTSVEGLLLGSAATGAVIVCGLIVYHRKRLSLVPDVPLLRMMRFGLPTMPAELSLYSLSFIDRIIIARSLGLAEAGLYSLAIKVAQSVNVLRGFPARLPAARLFDPRRRRGRPRLFGGGHLVRRDHVLRRSRDLADRPLIIRICSPGVFRAVDAVGPVAAGTALYALYMVLLVVLGRTGRTEFTRRHWSGSAPTSG